VICDKFGYCCTHSSFFTLLFVPTVIRYFVKFEMISSACTIDYYIYFTLMIVLYCYHMYYLAQARYRNRLKLYDFLSCRVVYCTVDLPIYCKLVLNVSIIFGIALLKCGGSRSSRLITQLRVCVLCARYVAYIVRSVSTDGVKNSFFFLFPSHVVRG
jgi:hypothetical protein